jgi:pimeloyl-ACP methyl ester carboxylesterase
MELVGRSAELGELAALLDRAAWFRHALPQAATEVWAGSGHFPHLAHPARFAERLAATA